MLVAGEGEDKREKCSKRKTSWDLRQDEEWGAWPARNSSWLVKTYRFLWQGCIIFDFKVSWYSFYNPPFPLSQTFGKDLLPSINLGLGSFGWKQSWLFKVLWDYFLESEPKSGQCEFKVQFRGHLGGCRRAEDTKKWVGHKRMVTNHLEHGTMQS